MSLPYSTASTMLRVCGRHPPLQCMHSFLGRRALSGGAGMLSLQPPRCNDGANSMCGGKRPWTGTMRTHFQYTGGAGHYDKFWAAENWKRRDWNERAFTVGVGGPVGAGKTALVLALCELLRDSYSLGVVTNDIFTQEDAEFLLRAGVLPADRIQAVETGGCPHTAIREDVSANLSSLEALTRKHNPIDFLLIESGGDNLAANFSAELADYTVYVIDVAGGDKIPRKGGPGITQSDVLVINKTDIADAVGADLHVMQHDAEHMRGDGPTVFAQVKHGKGVQEVAELFLQARDAALKGGAHGL
eukprot:m.202024 g.202024  ORF g.202024 m.202024 type:complete len:302 (-) comp21659_c0_seq1:46-951(-)